MYRLTVDRLAADRVCVHYLTLGEVALTCAAGKMPMGVLNTMAEFERDLLIKRTPAGIAHAHSEAKVIGQPAVLNPVRQAAVI